MLGVKKAGLAEETVKVILYGLNLILRLPKLLRYFSKIDLKRRNHLIDFKQ